MRKCFIKADLNFFWFWIKECKKVLKKVKYQKGKLIDIGKPGLIRIRVE